MRCGIQFISGGCRVFSKSNVAFRLDQANGRRHGRHGKNKLVRRDGKICCYSDVVLFTKNGIK